MEIDLPRGSKYTNLGEWLHSYTYAVFDGSKLELKKYKD
jgi:UDP-2,3-diacylglucosamine hydrolase